MEESKQLAGFTWRKNADGLWELVIGKLRCLVTEWKTLPTAHQWWVIAPGGTANESGEAPTQVVCAARAVGRAMKVAEKAELLEAE